MNISYDLWPIWCDYLEENGQDTELLRYVLTWGIWNNASYVNTVNYWSGVIDDCNTSGVGFWYCEGFTIEDWIGSRYGADGYFSDKIGDGYPKL